MINSSAMVVRKKVVGRRHRVGGKKLNKRQKNEVKKLIAVRQELKQFPGYTTGTASTSGTMVRLSSLVRGTTDTTYIGDEVNVKKFTIRAAALGTDEYNTIRFIVFRFRDDDFPNAPATSELIDTSGGAAYNVMAPYNHKYHEKFHVMADFTLFTELSYSFTSAGAVQSSQSSWVGSYKMTKRHTIFGKKLGAKKINFTDIASSAGFNHVYCCIITDSSPSTFHPTYWLSSELWYTDA